MFFKTLLMPQTKPDRSQRSKWNTLLRCVVLCYVWAVMYCTVLRVMHCVLSTVYCVRAFVQRGIAVCDVLLCTEQHTAHSTHCTMHITHNSQHTTHNTQLTAHHTARYTAQHTAYSTQRTVHSAHNSQHTTHSIQLTIHNIQRITHSTRCAHHCTAHHTRHRGMLDSLLLFCLCDRQCCVGFNCAVIYNSSLCSFLWCDGMILLCATRAALPLRCVSPKPPNQVPIMFDIDIQLELLDHWVSLWLSACLPND